MAKTNYEIAQEVLFTHLKNNTGTSSSSSSTSNGGRRKVRKTSTIVKSGSNRPIIVKNNKAISEYRRLYGNSLGNTKFVVRNGEGPMPPSTELPFAKKFSNFLQTQKGKGINNIEIKTYGGFQLGNGGDITSDLYKVLIKLNQVLSQPKYSSVTPITLTGGNDAYHQGKTLNKNSTYGVNGVFPTTTTHTRGLAIDVRSVNSTIDNLIIDALEEAGFTGILWHNPPHIHANIQ